MKDKKILIAVICWTLAALIWVGLTISGIIQKEEVWMIVFRAFVAVLAIVDAVIWIVRYSKSKAKAPNSIADTNDQK